MSVITKRHLITSTILIIIIVLAISGCSLISNSPNVILTKDANTVAVHNLTAIEYCNVNSNPNYLYVDTNFYTTNYDLFMYINQINVDLLRYKICFEALKKYNLDVVELIKKQRI